MAAVEKLSYLRNFSNRYNFAILKIEVGGGRYVEKQKYCHISATVRPITKEIW